MSFDRLAVPAFAASVAKRGFDLPPTTAPDEGEDIQRLRRRSPHPLPLPGKILPAQWHALVANATGYSFRWGDLLENPTELLAPLSQRAGGVSWRLLPWRVWPEYRVPIRAAHTRLFHVLEGTNFYVAAHIAPHVPDWVICKSMRTCFIVEFLTLTPAEADRARRWLANQFLPKRMQEVLADYRELILQEVGIRFRWKSSRCYPEEVLQ